MIGLIHSRKWALWFASFALVVIGLFVFARPAAAVDTGTIEGGKFVVEVDTGNWFGDLTSGGDVEINSENTTFALSPGATGSKTDINDGKVRITNVPVGSYTVTMNFKLELYPCRDEISNGDLITGGLLGTHAKDCPPEYYIFTKSWNVVVNKGQTSFLQGNESNSEKKLGKALKTNQYGVPVVVCDGKGMLMEFVICPMIENILGTIDWVMNNFIQPYLAVNPLSTKDSTGKESQIYTVWNNTRNIANLAFIAVFFVIVFSQATSIGISNYGIKKMLPRLVLIVIGTNISFFICAFLVDVFNVLGAGIASLLVSGILEGQPTITIGSDLFNVLFQGGPVGGVASLFAQGALGAAIIFGIFVFLFLGSIILFISAIVIILRQILLVFLIIASPLAFLAGLLPNTQKIFSQWFGWFSRLLAMYPIIMALFAASKIASTILGSLR